MSKLNVKETNGEWKRMELVDIFKKGNYYYPWGYERILQATDQQIEIFLIRLRFWFISLKFTSLKVFSNSSKIFPGISIPYAVTLKLHRLNY